MATHSTAARNAAANAVVDLIDLGSGNATGALVLMTAADAEVATLNLSNPAFGAASNGVATANSITADTNTTAGTVAKYKVVDRDGTTIFQGTISELALTTTTFGNGDTATCTSLTYTAPV